MDHYFLPGKKRSPHRPHDNGDVESSQRRLYESLDQASRVRRHSKRRLRTVIRSADLASTCCRCLTGQCRCQRLESAKLETNRVRNSPGPVFRLTLIRRNRSRSAEHISLMPNSVVKATDTPSYFNMLTISRLHSLLGYASTGTTAGPISRCMSRNDATTSFLASCRETRVRRGCVWVWAPTVTPSDDNVRMSAQLNTAWPGRESPS